MSSSKTAKMNALLVQLLHIYSNQMQKGWDVLLSA